MGLVVFLAETNGCMTQSTIKYAKGHPDKAWINNNFNRTYSAPDPNAEPHPSYYALLPLAVPADIVTSPFQLIGYGIFSGFAALGSSGGSPNNSSN